MLAMAIARLGEIASRKETLALRIKALDESRKLLARRLGQELNIPPDQVTVTRLCAQAPSAVATRLELAGRTLRETVMTCRELSENNACAARKGLELTGGMIDFMIREADPAGRLYTAPRPNAKRGGYTGMSQTKGSGFISRQA
jgi:hypothetical protein